MKKILNAIIGGMKLLFTGGQYGKFIEGKLCPKCQVRRIKLNRYCCKQCYNKYYA